jgi:hypothetical protein
MWRDSIMLVSRARCIACVACCLRFEHVRALRGVAFHVKETLAWVQKHIWFYPSCLWFIHSFLCSFYAYFLYDGESYRMWGGGCIREWAIHGPLNAGVITHYHQFDERLI